LKHFVIDLLNKSSLSTLQNHHLKTIDDLIQGKRTKIPTLNSNNESEMLQLNKKPLSKVVKIN
jgi:hypothetical protein